MEYEGSSPYSFSLITVSDPEFGAVRMFQVMYLWTILYYLYICVELPVRKRYFQNAEIMSVSFV